MINGYRKKIQSFAPWFHNIHLPDGTQTAPDHFLGDFPNFKWQQIKDIVPEDLEGWQVLDIGCNAGFYSLELAKRGAMVTAIDIDPHYLNQARWVAELYGLDDRITYKQQQVYDLANDTDKYDLVWFMGVFYHLRYPLLSMDIISEKCRNKLMFQTLMLPGKDRETNIYDRDINDRDDLFRRGWPKMAFIESKFSGDPTNWWLPNHSGVLSMMKTCGFKVLENPGDEIYYCEKDPENPAVVDSWNRSEYLSAIQMPWKGEVTDKVNKA
ncbi:MAG: TIGR04290 family methyltransferase [Candidatus Cyclobacteriaceae bacterium M3_2C_046]